MIGVPIVITHALIIRNNDTMSLNQNHQGQARHAD